MSNRQTAAILGLVNATVALLISFDVAFTINQQVTIAGVANALLAVVAVFWPAKE